MSEGSNSSAAKEQDHPVAIEHPKVTRYTLSGLEISSMDRAHCYALLKELNDVASTNGERKLCDSFCGYLAQHAYLTVKQAAAARSIIRKRDGDEYPTTSDTYPVSPLALVPQQPHEKPPVTTTASTKTIVKRNYPSKRKPPGYWSPKRMIQRVNKHKITEMQQVKSLDPKLSAALYNAASNSPEFRAHLYKVFARNIRKNMKTGLKAIERRKKVVAMLAPTPTPMGGTSSEVVALLRGRPSWADTGKP